MWVVMLQEKALVSTGRVRDEIGDSRVEIPLGESLGGTWGWEVVTHWPCVHPLCLPSSPRELCDASACSVSVCLAAAVGHPDWSW